MWRRQKPCHLRHSPCIFRFAYRASCGPSADVLFSISSGVFFFLLQTRTGAEPSQENSRRLFCSQAEGRLKPNGQGNSAVSFISSADGCYPSTECYLALGLGLRGRADGAPAFTVRDREFALRRRSSQAASRPDSLYCRRFSLA